VEHEGEVLSEQEGCLSVIGIRADVNRYASIVVEALGKSGLPVQIKADGNLAITLQHEIDHLNGKLFIDYMSKLRRDMYLRKIKKVLRRHKKYG
jgi:peptide deformylase